MAQVTDLNYSMENRLIKKLDLMVDRCGRDKVEKDALIIIEGSEGEGKSNSAVAIAYYMKVKLLEKFNEDRDIHLFFRLEQMINFAKRTEKKIIIWDEPSLDALKKDSLSYMNKLLERLLMTCRAKRHIFLVNMTKFYKFSEYIVVDRCLGLLHMYSRKEIDPGRFIYIKKKKLEMLYQTYLSKKKRMYKECKSFGGAFPEVMKKYMSQMNIYVDGIPNATYKIYSEQKNKAIESIGEDTKGMGKREAQTLRKLIELRKKVVMVARKLGLSNEKMAHLLEINKGRLSDWQNMDEKVNISLENDDFEGSSVTDIITMGGKGSEKIVATASKEQNDT